MKKKKKKKKNNSVSLSDGVEGKRKKKRRIATIKDIEFLF